jgi:hypothetical protein
VSSAAIPHLVDVAPYLPAASRRDLWIEIGLLVTAGAGRFGFLSEPGLQEGLTAALRTAETRAVLDFLADSEVTPGDSCYYALACVALAGHRGGRAMWEFLWPGGGYVRVVCPGCDAEYEVDGFADPLAPPCPAPAFISAPGGAAAWEDVAGAIERSGRDQVLGPGWDKFFRHCRAGCRGRCASASAARCRVVPSGCHGGDKVGCRRTVGADAGAAGRACAVPQLRQGVGDRGHDR